MPIANPEGRKKVDIGHSCWRSIFSEDPTKNKIDPNRNWGGSFQISSDEDIKLDADGGKKAFSILETKVVNDAIKEFDPDIFLDIHSGMEGLMYPKGSKDLKMPNTGKEFLTMKKI